MMLAAGYLLVLSAARQSFQQDIDNPNGAYSTSWTGLPIVMSVVYLSGVFGLTKYFENRKPMTGLKDYMFTYNLYQVIINVWCVVAFLLEVRRAGMSLIGNKVDLGPNSFRLGFVTWVHYNNKYVELLDTLWMVLRKKTQQVSFLHVYHHVLLMWAWFVVVKLGNGGDAYFGGLMNSIIHVMMYSYYTMALLGWSCPWKRYLTQAQLVQFCICLAHSTWAAVTGAYPWRICLVEVWVMVSMLVLFTRFYRQAYAKEAKAKEAKKLAQEASQAKAVKAE
uniref:Elongation of fatty acids protein n=1 Tax=Pavlova sp. CCMP459 TaxID=298111 RepID=Q5QEX8_9EUKA|nr:C20-polyunsaturated fatty acid elongating enzyme [Pavlova sp. CCMP459]